MFVKMYKYKIKKKSFQEWKKISDSAKKIYKKYGGGNSKRLIKKKNEYIEVIEFDYYKSKNDFLKITKKVNLDPKIDKLFQNFLSTLYQKNISKEEFKTV